jgi:DnaJ-domain-containing protein 1
MPVNKDIIIRFVLGLIFFLVAARVLGPVLFDLFKNKIPGAYNPDNDIDSMIRRQKERLRAQYGLQGDIQERAPEGASKENLQEKIVSKEVESLYKETKWGGGNFLKNIQTEITKNYSYSIGDSKINAFILLTEKRNYLSFLSSKNQESSDAIKNYLSFLLLFLMMVEEIRTKDFSIIAHVAKKFRIPPHEFALAIQLKLLSTINQKRAIKEDKLYSDSFILGQFSEETMREVIESVLKKEANLWAKGHSLFFEELSLHLTYAHILNPLPLLKDKKDLATAHQILGTDEEMELEEIKKIYKRMALAKHPDKIGSQNLPAILEKKAIAQFSRIQEAYEIITKSKG